MLVGFPLLLIPLAIINIIAFLMPGVSLGSPLYAVPLLSSTSWTITFSDALIAFAMLMLFFEVAKTARPGGKYLTDHLLSMLLCGAAVAELLLLKQFANSTFFLLTFLTFIDVISGIAIRMRQRGFVEAQPRVGSRQMKAPRVEPSVAPLPPEPQPQATPRDLPAHDVVIEPQRSVDVDVHAQDVVLEHANDQDNKPVTTAPDGSELDVGRPPGPQR